MTMRTTSNFVQRFQWLKYLLAGMGVPLALAILLAESIPSREELQRRQVEKAFGLNRHLMEESQRIDELAEKTRAMSEADWQTTMEAYKSGGKWAKILSMQTLAFLRMNNPHKAESTELAKDFIKSNSISDWHVPIRLLKGLGDESWKTYNEQGLKSSDAAIRQSYQSFDVNGLKLTEPPAPKK